MILSCTEHFNALLLASDRSKAANNKTLESVQEFIDVPLVYINYLYYLTILMNFTVC